MEYPMEELIPILAELTDRFTSKESTSVTYERARELMEAIMYCIRQCEMQGNLVDRKGLSAREAYQYGYQSLIEKIKNTQNMYNEMILHFCAYGNENYQMTVTRALPGFFRYYNPQFAPQETIITMDYPTICPVTDACGIHAIATYIEYIYYEQIFMGAFPQDYVYQVLTKFQASYRKQFYNICIIILRHVLGHMMIDKKLGQECGEEEYDTLKSIIRENDQQWLEETLANYLTNLITAKYHSNHLLENYLKEDLKNFTVELHAAAENNCLEKVIIL